MKHIFLYCFLIFASTLLLQVANSTPSTSTKLASQNFHNVIKRCQICSHKCVRAYEHQAGQCMPYIGDKIDKFPKACQNINLIFNACQRKCACASG